MQLGFLAATALLLGLERRPLPRRRIRRSTPSSPRSRRSADSTTPRSRPTAAASAWSRKVADTDGRERLGAISVAERSDRGRLAASRPPPDGKPRRELEPVFSPDGRSIAFLSDAARPDQLQVYVALDRGRRRVAALTKVKGQLQELRWSPDGKSVVLPLRRGLGAGDRRARRAQARLRVPSRRTTTSSGSPSPTSRRATSAASRRPTSTSTTTTGRPTAEVLRRGGRRRLGHQQLLGRAALPRATAPSGSGALDLEAVAAARVSALLAGRPLDRRHPRHHERRGLQRRRRLARAGGARLAGGAPRNLTPGDAVVRRAASAWRSPSELLFAGHLDGGFGVAAIDPATGRLDDAYVPEPRSSPTSEPRAARTARRRDPRVLRGCPRRSGPAPFGAWKKLSSVNASAKRFWGEAKSLHWESDGATVQGWLLYPDAFDPRRERPVSDGRRRPRRSRRAPRRPPGRPAGRRRFLRRATSSFCRTRAAASVSARPSREGNVKDFGGGDLRDILTGVDAVLAQATPRIDPKRLGITGWSYGGYMTMWAVTQTDRFAAGRRGRRHRELAELLRPEQDRHLDAPLLRGLGLRRSEGLREVLADRVHQEGEDADPRPPRRARLRGPDAPGLRVLARAEGARRADAARDLHRRGPLDPQAREPARHRQAQRRLVRHST